MDDFGRIRKTLVVKEICYCFYFDNSDHFKKNESLMVPLVTEKCDQPYYPSCPPIEKIIVKSMEGVFNVENARV